MVKCMVHNGFCELHMCDTNDNGHCPVGEVFAPQLPATQLGARPFGGMCEVCGTQVAVHGMYECEECLARMAKDYE